MMNYLKNYSKIVGSKVIDQIIDKAEKFSNKHILAINSTYQGGGVAEMLNSLVVLFHELGLDYGWRILHGNPDFFKITKSFHNALQGAHVNISDRIKKIYYETNERFSKFTHINNHDLVIVHDPQPLPLITFYTKNQPWIWRAHIDITHPNPYLWEYLKPFIEQYDHMVYSVEEYRKNLSVSQSVIFPAIDPLTMKNRNLQDRTISKKFMQNKIDTKKPIISQISRFDKWKDPIGVLKIFEMVKKEVDCQLILLGSFAIDDPEGQQIFERVHKKVEKSKYHNDIKLILNATDTLVNCIQKASSVVIQKSLREGFGLVVSEALYKGTPVVASKVGGIPLQIMDGYNGFLHEPNDYKGFSESIKKILTDQMLREKLGRNATEHVKKYFLITRLMLDWLGLFEKFLT
jgi:trehalose synthase